MSALRILIQELARGGGITTYRTLMRRHGDEYDLNDFAHAVHRARKKGIVATGKRGAPIVAAGACPCCGQALRREQ